MTLVRAGVLPALAVLVIVITIGNRREVYRRGR
jgi:hypothetical protein